MNGKIKWYNPMKGFGFVEGEDGQDYFIHHSQLPVGAAPKEGEGVTFEAVETDKGKQAQNVVLSGEVSVEDEAPAEEESEEAEVVEEETTEEVSEEEAPVEEESEEKKE